MAEAAGRRMTGAVQSGLEPTEADLCNPQMCSCLLELLPLLPDMAAGTVCLDSATASVFTQAAFDDWQCQAAQAGHDCQIQTPFVMASAGSRRR